MKKFLIGLGIFLVLAGGVGVSLYLVKQEQDVRSKASTTTGTVTINLSPQSGEIPAGGSLPITVAFNPASNLISAVALRLTFSYSGDVSDLSAQEITLDSGLANGDWTCPVKLFEAKNGTANIDFACANVNTSGYTAVGETSLMTFNLVASPTAKNATYTLTFDPQESIITKKADGVDVLLTPSSEGTYSITGGTTVTDTTVTSAETTTVTQEVIHKYRCSGTSCILDDVSGIYRTENCNNACSVAITKKYRCASYSCVEDDTLGTYLTSNCNNACLVTTTPTGQTTLPRTGNTETVLAIAGAGLAFLVMATLLVF